MNEYGTLALVFVAVATLAGVAAPLLVDVACAGRGATTPGGDAGAWGAVKAFWKRIVDFFGS